MPASRQTLGSKFRLARESKGVSLAEAQQATKVRQAFLAALENDDYSTLPPSVYVRGFIKNYASFLGLNPQTAVQEFDEMLEAAAAGYEPYYGSSDSGGKGIHPEERSQLLSGLSQGEARLVEHGPDSLNAQPLPVAKPTEENLVDNGTISEQEGKNSELEPDSENDDTSVTRTLVKPLINPPVGFQPYEKYVLRPAMQPVNRPALYIPNFVPFLLVLVIAGAALLLLYRGLVMPKTSDTSGDSTATPNAYSAATVTPLTNGNIFENNVSGNVYNSTITTTITVPSNAIISPPPFFTPITTAPSAVKTTVVAPPGSGLGINTATSAATPVPVATTSAATATPSGPTATPTADPSKTVTVEVSVSQSQSWIGVVVDGDSKFAKYFNFGDPPLVFTGKQIEVRAGAPGVVLIKVNGVSKPYTTPNSGIITHIFKADGTDYITK